MIKEYEVYLQQRDVFLELMYLLNIRDYTIKNCHYNPTSYTTVYYCIFSVNAGKTKHKKIEMFNNTLNTYTRICKNLFKGGIY